MDNIPYVVIRDGDDPYTEFLKYNYQTKAPFPEICAALSTEIHNTLLELLGQPCVDVKAALAKQLGSLIDKSGFSDNS